MPVKLFFSGISDFNITLNTDDKLNTLLYDHAKNNN